MKEGEIQIISDTCSGNVSNYSNYKTMRNGDVVQVERWDSKAWAGNGAPAGIKFADLCDNCCEKIHQAIVDTANSLKR